MIQFYIRPLSVYKFYHCQKRDCFEANLPPQGIRVKPRPIFPFGPLGHTPSHYVFSV
jgi:hypothetical protein